MDNMKLYLAYGGDDIYSSNGGSDSNAELHVDLSLIIVVSFVVDSVLSEAFFKVTVTALVIVKTSFILISRTVPLLLCMFL
jgi:hypothetical protein